MRTSRGPALLTSLLIAVPLVAGCSGSAEDDVLAAADAFLADWAGGDLEAAAAATTDPELATTLPPADGRGPPRRHPLRRLRQAHDRGRHRDHRLDRHVGSRRRAGLGLRRDSAAPRGRGRLGGRRRAGPDPSRAGRGAAPGRVPVAAGAGHDHRRLGRTPVHPDRGRQRRHRPGAGHRPARAGRRALGRHRHRGRGHHRRRRGRPRGPVRPGHHPAPSGLRGDPGPGVRPARRRLPDRDPAAGAQRAVRRRAARSRRRGHRRGHRGEQRGRRAALRRRRPAGSVRTAAGLPGAADRHARLHRPGGQHRRGDRRRGPRDRRRRTGAGGAAADAARARDPERRGRRRRDAAAADAHRRRAARHRGDPRGLLERGRRRHQRPRPGSSRPARR